MKRILSEWSTCSEADPRQKFEVWDPPRVLLSIATLTPTYKNSITADSSIAVFRTSTHAAEVGPRPDPSIAKATGEAISSNDLPIVSQDPRSHSSLHSDQGAGSQGARSKENDGVLLLSSRLSHRTHDRPLLDDVTGSKDPTVTAIISITHYAGSVLTSHFNKGTARSAHQNSNHNQNSPTNTIIDLNDHNSVPSPSPSSHVPASITSRSTHNRDSTTNTINDMKDHYDSTHSTSSSSPVATSYVLDSKNLPNDPSSSSQFRPDQNIDIISSTHKPSHKNHTIDLAISTTPSMQIEDLAAMIMAGFASGTTHSGLLLGDGSTRNVASSLVHSSRPNIAALPSASITETSRGVPSSADAFESNAQKVSCFSQMIFAIVLAVFML